MKKILLLLMVTAASCAIIAYEVAVSQRNNGNGTHVGNDVILLGYICPSLLLLTALILAPIIRKKERTGLWIFLLPLAPFIALVFWTFLTQSGRVSYYIKSGKTEPNQALQTMQFAVTPAASHPSRQQTACLI
jgi:hypothetical protein